MLDLQAMLAELEAREAASETLHGFIEYVRPGYKASAFSRSLCGEIDQFLVDVMAGRRPVLVIRVGPQHGKSEVVSRQLPPYIFGKYPDLSIACISYAETLARRMGRAVQTTMASQRYANVFPARWTGGKRTGRIQNAQQFEVPGARGTYRSVGVGGPLTGEGLHIAIVDDPIKNAEEAASEKIKDGLEDWFQSVLMTRMAEESGTIIMHTAWAEDDLGGRVLKAVPRARLINYPALALPGDILGRAEGEPLVPALHSLEQLLEIKATMSDYFWSAMYQGSPKPAGGNIFKDTGVRYWTQATLPERFDRVVASWDMTFKDTKGSDYVVGQVWGKKGANAYLLHQVRARMGFVATCTATERMHTEWPEAMRTLVEDKANGPAVIDALRAVVPGLIPIEPDGSKEARAHAVSGYWEAGNVYLPHPDSHKWVKDDLVPELTAFPNGAHDDQVDAMTQALRDLYPRGGVVTRINPNNVMLRGGNGQRITKRRY